MTTRFDAAGRPTPEALADERQLQERFPGYRGVDADYVHAGSEALERWWDRKFGIRIHWSLYSITGNGPESWPRASTSRSTNSITASGALSPKRKPAFSTRV